MTDLYEFPAGYIGRKSYVSVRGHSKSVPKHKTYLGSDGRRHLHPDFGGDWSGYSDTGPFILPDKLEYVSPIDGTHVTSRSHHREHLRRNDVIECGDAGVGYSTNRDRNPMPRVGYDVKRAIEQLRSR